MMRSKLHEEGPSVNIVMRSSIDTREDKGKQLEENVWVRKAVDKETRFDVNNVKKMFMEAKMSFRKEGYSTLRTQSTGKLEDTSTTEEGDPSLLASFLKIYMKLLRDKKASEILQELIDNCTSKNKPLL